MWGMWHSKNELFGSRIRQTIGLSILNELNSGESGYILHRVALSGPDTHSSERSTLGPQGRFRNAARWTLLRVTSRDGEMRHGPIVPSQR